MRYEKRETRNGVLKIKPKGEKREPERDSEKKRKRKQRAMNNMVQ
jgi:hypothetical protein